VWQGTCGIQTQLRGAQLATEADERGRHHRPSRSAPNYQIHLKHSETNRKLGCHHNPTTQWNSSLELNQHSSTRSAGHIFLFILSNDQGADKLAPDTIRSAEDCLPPLRFHPYPSCPSKPAGTSSLTSNKRTWLFFPTLMMGLHFRLAIGKTFLVNKSVSFQNFP
jgi:hypothetical protein